MTRNSFDLEVRDLTIEYVSGGYTVRPIHGLDLDGARGEIMLLLGASGCGKTTVLSVLAAILTPTAGRVRFDDIDVTGLRGAPLNRYRQHTVGIMFQAFNLVPSLTARENIQVPLSTARVSGRAARQRAGALLAQVGLSERARHRPGDLSGGQQQRVAIARALANDPPLVLADEPTAHLDYTQVDGVLRLLRQIADAGRLVVVATHDDRMLPLADRVVNLTPRHDTESRPPETVTLESGEVLFDHGDPDELVYVVEHGASTSCAARTAATSCSPPWSTAGTSVSWHRRSGCAAPPPPGRRHPAPSPATRCATSATGYDPAAWGTR